MHSALLTGVLEVISPCNGRSEMASVLTSGNAAVQKSRVPKKAAPIFGNRNRKRAHSNFDWYGQIFLERGPNCNIGPFSFGILPYFRCYPRAPLESQISGGGMSFAIPVGSGDSVESRTIYRSKIGQCCNLGPVPKKFGHTNFGPRESIFTFALFCPVF